MGLTVFLGQVPPVYVGQHWWPLSCGSCEGTVVEVAKWWEVSVHSLVLFPSRKLARSVGTKGASPKIITQTELDLLLHQVQGQTLHPWPLQRRASFGMHGNTASLHLTPRILLGRRWRSPRGQFSCLSVGWECRGLGDGEKCLMGWLGEVSMLDSEGEGLWHHCDSLLWVLLLCLDRGHHSLDWDCLIDESSLRHLAAFIPQGPAKGDQGCEDEQWWEHLWPQEVGPADASPSLGPALAMHQLSCCVVPSCTLPAASGGVHWGSAHTPPVHLFHNIQYL